MSILAAFMVPHPPLIIPDVGRGGEKQILPTTRAYWRVAEEIAALKPETVIITSPHAEMYADYIHIAPGKRAKGSFAEFGAPQVSFNETYDEELVDRICLAAEERNFPAGTLGERNARLDHGTMVPLWFIRQKYDGFRLVRTGLAGLPLTDHYIFGQILKEAADRIGRKTVLIASGDLSHKLKASGPYGFAAEGPEYDARIMDCMGRGAFGELFSFEEAFLDKAAECGHRSFTILAGALDGMDVKAEAYSHQDVTGVGYGIASFYPGANNPERKFLDRYLRGLSDKLEESREASDAYVDLARASVEHFVKTGKRLRLPGGLPEELLNTRAGAFVSLHKHGRLRGCIGTIQPTTGSVAEEILRNAVSACSEDPRFSPVREDELPWLEISVDVLGEPERIRSISELDVKRYGVIVSLGRRRGLLLPDLDGVDTPEEQVSIAMQKGGIRPGEPYTLERFEVVRHT